MRSFSRCFSVLKSNVPQLLGHPTDRQAPKTVFLGLGMLLQKTNKIFCIPFGELDKDELEPSPNVYIFRSFGS